MFLHRGHWTLRLALPVSMTVYPRKPSVFLTSNCKADSSFIAHLLWYDCVESALKQFKPPPVRDSSSTLHIRWGCCRFYCRSTSSYAKCMRVAKTVYLRCHLRRTALTQSQQYLHNPRVSLYPLADVVTCEMVHATKHALWSGARRNKSSISALACTVAIQSACM